MAAFRGSIAAIAPFILAIVATVIEGLASPMGSAISGSYAPA